MKGMEKLDERSTKRALADPVGAWKACRLDEEWW